VSEVEDIRGTGLMAGLVHKGVIGPNGDKLRAICRYGTAELIETCSVARTELCRLRPCRARICEYVCGTSLPGLVVRADNRDTAADGYGIPKVIRRTWIGRRQLGLL
jgi:hypothetical protein